MPHEAAASDDAATDEDRPYVHQTSDIEQRRLARRTAASGAGFLLPHLRPGMRLLDCGCGVGSITVGLAEAVAPGEVVGIDFQVAQVARARALAAERGVANVRFEVASIYDLPFPDAAFDVAFANTVVQHLAEPRRALREMRRVLTPGGLVGIADSEHGATVWEPRTPLITAALDLFLRVMAHHGGGGHRARHHRRLLLEAGFARPVATATLGNFGAWGTPEDTRLIAAWFADQLRTPAIAALALAQGWADQATLEAMAAEVLAWGERPDAFAVVMGVAALGWAEATT